MLLQELCAYADRELDLPPAGYQRQPIRYIIDLDEQGISYGPVIDTADRGSKQTEKGVQRLAPHLKRAMGIRPKLLADHAAYVLGVPRLNDRTERVPAMFDAFAALVDACLAATDAPEVRAVARFLRGEHRATLTLPTDFDPAATLTFRVNGTFPVDTAAVRAFWAKRQAGESGDEAIGSKTGGGRLPCVVCGEFRPALRIHPLKIKGIPGGQTSGTDLISANADVFESFGLESALIAPTCGACAEKYANGLNALLADQEARFWTQEGVHVFWTTGGGNDFRRFLVEPDATEVRELLNAARSGKRAALEIDANAFFALGLTASGARSAVRSWITTTVGEARGRLARYFRLQELVDARTGLPGEPVRLYFLAGAGAQNVKKNGPPEAIVAALLSLAITGAPLPADALYQVVQRCRAEQGVTYERAVLIKMVLGSRPGVRDEEIDAMQQLDQNNESPAYLCGRLLAVLDSIQRLAINPKATLVDRYYGTASSAPATVYGSLLRMAQSHLAKLRKDPTKAGAYYRLDERMTEVMDRLDGAGGFPTSLTLQEQGRFALGFYHQKAETQRQRIAGRVARDAALAVAADGELVDDEVEVA